MTRLGFLLRPGWIALALVVVGFAYLLHGPGALAAGQEYDNLAREPTDQRVAVGPIRSR